MSLYPIVLMLALVLVIHLTATAAEGWRWNVARVLAYAFLIGALEYYVDARIERALKAPTAAAVAMRGER